MDKIRSKYWYTNLCDNSVNLTLNWLVIFPWECYSYIDHSLGAVTIYCLSPTNNGIRVAAGL